MREPQDDRSDKRESPPPLGKRLYDIAAELGFYETPELRQVRDKLAPDQLTQDSIKIIIEYQKLGEKVVETNADRGPRPQIGLIVAMSAIKYTNGFIDESREDVEDAIEYAKNIGDFETLNKLLAILITELNKPYKQA